MRSKILILSQPIFDREPFRAFAEDMIAPGSRIFVVNYANERRMLKIRFNRDGSPEITRKYYRELAKKLSTFGVSAEDITFSDDGDSREDFLRAYERADLLIFCGGAAESLLDQLEAFSVTELIQTTEKPMIAYSAGAEVLLDRLLLLPSTFWPGSGDYYQGYAVRAAIGRIHDLVLAFHYKPAHDPWLWESADFLGKPIEALTDESGLLWEDGNITWIGERRSFFQNTRIE